MRTTGRRKGRGESCGGWRPLATGHSLPRQSHVVGCDQDQGGPRTCMESFPPVRAVGHRLRRHAGKTLPLRCSVCAGAGKAALGEFSRSPPAPRASAGHTWSESSARKRRGEGLGGGSGSPGAGRGVTQRAEGGGQSQRPSPGAQPAGQQPPPLPRPGRLRDGRGRGRQVRRGPGRARSRANLSRVRHSPRPGRKPAEAESRLAPLLVCGHMAPIRKMRPFPEAGLSDEVDGTKARERRLLSTKPFTHPVRVHSQGHPQPSHSPEQEPLSLRMPPPRGL